MVHIFLKRNFVNRNQKLNLPNTTTILLFSRSANAESKTKILHRNPQINIALHQALFNKTVAILKATNLPFLIIDENMQQGCCFADRYCNAIDYAFGHGVKNVIAVGSDCASLNTQMLLMANEQLQNGICTIGKDTHGGFYLMALNKKQYNRSVFSQFNWCTKSLFADVANYFSSIKIATFLLPCLCDINTTADLKTILKNNFRRFFILLKSIVQSLCTKCKNEGTYFYTSVIHFHFCLKAPPIFN